MPYALRNIATRARPWRDIVPGQNQGTSLYNAAYRPILAVWATAGAAMLASYGDTEQMEAEDADANREAEATIAILLMLGFYMGLETWHRRKWLSSVANSAGVDVSVLLQSPTGFIAGRPNRLARRSAIAATGGGRTAAVRVAQGVITPSAALTGIDGVLANAVAVTSADVRAVSNAARARLANVIFNGLQAGRSKDDVARDVAKGLAGDRTKALKSAQDQVVRASKAIDRFRLEEAGFTSAQWNHKDQLRPRPTHLRRDKEVIPLNDPRWMELNWAYCKCTASPPPLLRPGRGNLG